MSRAAEEEEEHARRLEGEHVRAVYDEIAGHFSATRYKAWPVVERFVRRQRPGSLGLDVGCGNGKNMRIRPAGEVYMHGLDLSAGLLAICREGGLEAVHGSMLSIPMRSASHDFVLCIAALHHLASEERRRAALHEMARLLVVGGGAALIYVWAQEQPAETSSVYRHALTFLSADRQDVLVPWTMRAAAAAPPQRFYHLFRRGELEALVEGMRPRLLAVEESGYDRDNWYVVARRVQ